MSDSEHSDNSSIDSSSDEETHKIESKIKTVQLRSFYDQYLKNNKINLSPEYQREFCWNNEKQNLLIDSIMKNYILPMFIIIKNKNKNKENPYEYECIDGQHRFTIIKNYIEGKRITDKHPYWKVAEKEKKSYSKIFYEKTKDISTAHYSHKKYMTEEEKEQFNNFDITVCQIETPLTFQQITKIFFRLQNGEKVRGTTTFLNNDHPLCELMRKNKLGKTATYDSDWFSKFKKLVYKRKKCSMITTVVNHCMGVILILLRDSIYYDFGATYLAMNLQRAITENQPNLSAIKCKTEMETHGIFDKTEDILDKIKHFTEDIYKKVKDKDIIIQLPFFYVLYYIYLHEEKSNSIMNFVIEKHFEKYNNDSKYKLTKDKIINRDKLKEVYKEIIDEYKESKYKESKYKEIIDKDDDKEKIIDKDDDKEKIIDECDDKDFSIKKEIDDIRPVVYIKYK